MSTAHEKDPVRVRTGRLGALKLHASGKTTTTAARAAFMERFRHQVDPDNVLDPAERDRRAGYALREHMARMALARHRTKAA